MNISILNCLSKLCSLALSLGHDHGHSDSESDHAQAHKDDREKENLSIRAAFIHVLGDLIQSVGVLIAALIIWIKPQWRLADPICTIIFSVIVVISTIFISRDIIKILMEGKRENIERVFKRAFRYSDPHRYKSSSG